VCGKCPIVGVEWWARHSVAGGRRQEPDPSGPSLCGLASWRRGWARAHWCRFEGIGCMCNVAYGTCEETNWSLCACGMPSDRVQSCGQGRVYSRAESLAHGADLFLTDACLALAAPSAEHRTGYLPQVIVPDFPIVIRALICTLSVKQLTTAAVDPSQRIQ